MTTPITLEETTGSALERYATAIHLHEAFVPMVLPPGMDEEQAFREAIEWLLGERGQATAAATGAAAYPLLRNLLTVRGPGTLPPRVEACLDGILSARARARGAVGRAEILAEPGPRATVGATALKVRRGDMTRLAVDAIVNAANADLLGCFRPGHACIDNAIHSAAGPRLREDCARIVEIQGGRERTADAKITRAYHLPSRFVLHTVGPIVGDGRVHATDERALACCYSSCLDLARAVPAIRTLAFCAISTGVFGYPKNEAAEVAVRAVAKWLQANGEAFDLVVFCVFSDLDERAYAVAMDACGRDLTR
jgi:O-acetyl-ADP-ribose deacetylase (regulator of RNase III)